MEGKTLFNRYKVLKTLAYQSTSYPLILTQVWKCFDKWSEQIVALKFVKCLDAIDLPELSIQKIKGLMIASDLQQQSDNFLKINDITYGKLPNYGEGFFINTEYMGKHYNIYLN